jgi:DNA polymerase-3 subunit alpha
LEAEKSVLGFYLSGHPLQQYAAELGYFTNGKISALTAEVERSRGKMEVKVAGLVVEIKHQPDKNRCFVTLEDDTGKLDVGIFSEIYDSCRPLVVKDALLIAEGQLEKNAFSGMLRLSAKKLYSFEQARANLLRAIEFEWDCRQPSVSNSFFQELRELLAPFKGGSCPLIIRYVSVRASAQVQLGAAWKVHASDELLLRLQRFQAIKTVELKYK